MTGRKKLDEIAKRHSYRVKIPLVPLKVTRCHDIAVLVVMVLNVLHLAKVFNSPRPAHSGHACLIQECTSSRFDHTHIRLDQAIALMVMWFAEVVFPFEVSNPQSKHRHCRNQSAVP